MAENKGGPLSMLGITPEFVTGTTSTIAGSVAQSSTNRLFKGVGNQALAQAGSAVVGNLTTNVVTIGLNSILGTEVTGAAGLSLDTGSNILASTVTPYVTASLAQGINQSIEKSLQSAGPFGSILAQVGTSLVNQGVNSLNNLIAGGTTPGSGAAGGGSKFFPGGGYEPNADYSGGKSYTLGSNGPDVTFAIRPANAGPLLAGGLASVNQPSVPTSLAATSLKDPSKVQNPAVNTLKSAEMKKPVPTLGSPRSRSYAGG